MTINGNLYDHESVTIQINSTGEAIGVTEISYSDERPIKPRYGRGGTARGYGRKNYASKGSMTLDRDEAEDLRKSLGGSYYEGYRPFPIIVAYANDDQPEIVDTLPDCMITKADTSDKQDDDNSGVVKFDYEILSPIKWNGVPAYGRRKTKTT